MSKKKKGVVLRKLDKDELMVNLAFKTLCVSMKSQIKNHYNEFEYEYLSKDDIGYLFEILVTSEKYTKVYLEDFADNEEMICILSKSKNAAKIFLQDDELFSDVIEFDKKTLNIMIEILYNYNLIDETTDFFIRLVEKINCNKKKQDNEFFFSCLKALSSKNEKVNEYMLRLKTLLVIS